MDVNIFQELQIDKGTYGFQLFQPVIINLSNIRQLKTCEVNTEDFLRKN